LGSHLKIQDLPWHYLGGKAQDITNVMIALALVFALVAALIAFAFLRPAPVQTALGVIRSNLYKLAGEYWQQPVGNRDGFWTPTRIPIAECHVFGILVEGRPGEARIAAKS
jgi:hypothetical protein